MSGTPPTQPPAPVNEDQLYGEFLKNMRWRDRLARRATHKALNMTDEDMNISVRNGMTWRELLVIAGLATSLLAGGLAGLNQMLKKDPPPPQAPVQQGTDTDTNTLYDFSISSGPQQ